METSRSGIPGWGKLSGRTVALTGATGFLGSHICDLLLDAGCQVRVSVRATSNQRWLEGKDLDIRQVDLNNLEECQNFVTDCQAMIHCAGMVSALREEDYQRANVDTTRTLLEAARSRWSGSEDQTFLLISSLAAHGPAPLDRPAVETDPLNPITAYGRSKQAAEKVLFQGDWPFRCVSLRPPGLYGPRDTEFVPLFKAARLGITARIGTRMTGLSLIDGRDAAGAAVALLASEQAAGSFFVDDGQKGYSWPDLADALTETFGRKVRTWSLPMGLLRFVAGLVGSRRAARSPILNPDRLADLDADGWVCDGSHLVKVTGFEPRFGLIEGFRTTSDFLREQGIL